MSKPKYTLKDLKKLPSYSDALKLPYEEFKKYAEGVKNHSSYCFGFFKPRKIKEWCKGIGCNVKGQPCTWNPITPAYNFTVPGGSITTPIMYNTTLAPVTPRPLQDVGYNGTCYDDYLCDAAWMAGLNHTVLGLCAFVFCLIGVLGHTLCIPAFNFSLNRSGTTLYMTGVAVADIIYLILQALIVVIYYFPSVFIDQLRVYGTFSGYLVPYGVPAMELCELMSVWFIVVLLFDRHLYLKYGFYSKTICTKSLAAKAMIGIFTVLGLYTIPKFFEYHIVKYGRDGLIRVVYSLIGENEMYQNLMTHWLKVPIEMFLPYLGVVVFTLMVVAKLIDTHSVRQKKMANMATGDGNMAREPTEKELFEQRENANTMIAMLYGITLLVVKIPKFTLHVLVTEHYVSHRKVVLFELASRLLDVVFAFCKPFICLCLGHHFCKALGLMFCCRSDTTNPRKQPEIVEMNYARPESQPLTAVVASSLETKETDIRDVDDAIQAGHQCA